MTPVPQRHDKRGPNTAALATSVQYGSLGPSGRLRGLPRTAAVEKIRVTFFVVIVQTPPTLTPPIPIESRHSRAIPRDDHDGSRRQFPRSVAQEAHMKYVKFAS
jgi:hypothetical protein